MRGGRGVWCSASGVHTLWRIEMGPKRLANTEFPARARCGHPLVEVDGGFDRLQRSDCLRVAQRKAQPEAALAEWNRWVGRWLQQVQAVYKAQCKGTWARVLVFA